MSVKNTIHFNMFMHIANCNYNSKLSQIHDSKLDNIKLTRLISYIPTRCIRNHNLLY